VDCDCRVEGVGLDLVMKGWVDDGGGVDDGMLEGLGCGLGRMKEVWVGSGTGVVGGTIWPPTTRNRSD
jgi:hypothetical protein